MASLRLRVTVQDDTAKLNRDFYLLDTATISFESLDTNKDGVLSKAEVRDLARDLYDGRDCPDKSLRKFLQVARGFELKERITFKDFCYFARCAKAAFGAKPRSYQPPICSEK